MHLFGLFHGADCIANPISQPRKLYTSLRTVVEPLQCFSSKQAHDLNFHNAEELHKFDPFIVGQKRLAMPVSGLDRLFVPVHVAELDVQVSNRR
jgi:hypothetical protein